MFTDTCITVEHEIDNESASKLLFESNLIKICYPHFFHYEPR